MVSGKIFAQEVVERKGVSGSRRCVIEETIKTGEGFVSKTLSRFFIVDISFVYFISAAMASAMAFIRSGDNESFSLKKFISDSR